ncbi:unnamed protein product [Pleuronectes platessa]|uniref:Uncharacterized protein n=1 Tax=Pleuronectes platessa TaxID=8262 RepID=A0A9N7YKG4_PLEPL|nr:unnamed protein product [Pleuronectes platessa]
MHKLPYPPLSPTAFTVGRPQAHHALSADGALSTTMRGKRESLKPLQTFCQQHRANAFRTYGKINVLPWEQRCCSLAVVIIWKAALQQQLARPHEGRREEGNPGKSREQRGLESWNNRMENRWVLRLWLRCGGGSNWFTEPTV